MSKKIKIEGAYDGEAAAVETSLQNKIEIDHLGHIVCNGGDVINQYQIEKHLGQGYFGRVVQAKDTKTGNIVALKIFKTEKRHSAIRELIAMDIISEKDSFDTSFCMKMLDWFDYHGHVCIVLNVLGLSVYDFMQENDFTPYTLVQVRHIGFQLCHSVNFLHGNGLTHTDVKPENILFVNSSYTTSHDSENNREVRHIRNTDVQLIDFGNSVREKDYHMPLINTRYYRAPEVIMQLGWDEATDVWSIGCCLFEIYFGNLLFPTHNDGEHLAMMQKVLGDIPRRMANECKTCFRDGKLEYDWNEASADLLDYCQPLNEYKLSDGEDDADLFDLIRKMLDFEPSHRIKLSEALTHPFFRKLQPHQRLNKNNKRKSEL